MRKPRRILALLPGLAGHGGIQQHNRMFCGVVTRWCASHDAALDVVSLRDPRGWQDRRYVARAVTGCEDNRYRFALQSALALARPYDLLIVGVVDFGVLLTIPRLLCRRAPILTIVHGIEVWKELTRSERAALTQATRVMSVSDYTAREVIERHRVRPERLVTVPIPLDPEFVSEADSITDPPRPGSVLTVARMNVIDREKGVETLIRAVAEARPSLPGLRCTIVGDGEDRPRLEQLSRELGVADAVRFTGGIDDRELHTYLAGTEVFALPSRKEGFGIVFLEAMYYGKPVIAGAHGGSVEVVDDGVTGLHVQYGDVSGLAQALRELLGDDRRRAEIGAAGRAAVEQRFAFDRFSQRVEALLAELLPVS
jgi:glycosyltransferase involved in cell wall biosynthesis